MFARTHDTFFFSKRVLKANEICRWTFNDILAKSPNCGPIHIPSIVFKIRRYSRNFYCKHFQLLNDFLELFTVKSEIPMGNKRRFFSRSTEKRFWLCLERFYIEKSKLNCTKIMRAANTWVWDEKSRSYERDLLPIFPLFSSKRLLFYLAISSFLRLNNDNNDCYSLSEKHWKHKMRAYLNQSDNGEKKVVMRNTCVCVLSIESSTHPMFVTQLRYQHRLRILSR